MPAEEAYVPQPLALPVKPAQDRARLWLALALTPGLGRHARTVHRGVSRRCGSRLAPFAYRKVALWNRAATSLPCPGEVTNKNAWGPNILIKQRAKLQLAPALNRSRRELHLYSGTKENCLEFEVSCSEIFAVLFEPAGEVKLLPGKNFVQSF